MIERHWHWKFVAYDGEPKAKELTWAVTIEVVGYLCEADARIAAQDIVRREQYGLTSVWECAACGFQAATAESMAAIAENSSENL